MRALDDRALDALVEAAHKWFTDANGDNPHSWASEIGLGKENNGLPFEAHYEDAVYTAPQKPQVNLLCRR